MLQLEDITTIQGKPFVDQIAYLACAMKPKAVYYAGASDTGIHNLLTYNRDQEKIVHREEHVEEIERPDGKGGRDEPVQIRFTEKSLERKFVGPCLLQTLFLSEQGVERAEVDATLANDSVKNGARIKVEYVPENGEQKLVERATGEGHEEDEGFVTDLENTVFDLIIFDATRFAGQIDVVMLNSLDIFFEGALLVTGLKNRESILWNLMQRYGGSCIFVVSSADEGSVLLLREEIVLS